MARSEAASGDIRVALSVSRAAGATSLQAEAWLAWLLAASVAVFLTSNPFYLALACLAGLVVYESLPRGQRRRAYGLIVKIGIFFALLSIPFNVLTGSSGATAVVELPRLSFPGWLGGVTLGGDVTAESLLYAASKAMRLVALLLFATAFNVGVDHYRLLRLVPPALRQLGVVVTVAVLLLPQAFAQGRAVAEAQRLRGHRMRGLRSAGAFVVPVLAGALERSIQRAESLDARGFGSRPAGESTSLRAKALVVVSVALMAAGLAAYLYYRDSPLPAVAAMAGAAVTALLATRARGDAATTTRYSREALARPSTVVMACAALSVALLAGTRAVGAGGVAYYPFPTATVPELNPLAVVAVLLLLAPALFVVAGGGREDAGDD